MKDKGLPDLRGWIKNIGDSGNRHYRATSARGVIYAIEQHVSSWPGRKVTHVYSLGFVDPKKPYGRGGGYIWPSGKVVGHGETFKTHRTLAGAVRVAQAHARKRTS